MKRRDAPLNRDFFQSDPLTCARDLIGCELLWRGCGGIIVETEAYSVRNDEACHTFSRPSSRHFVAEHPPGSAYIYLNYGVHWLLNFLVKGGTEDGFVLIRALEPTRETPGMCRRRKTNDLRRLCSGPGKLTQALGIDGSGHGVDFFQGNLLTLRAAIAAHRIAQGPRIGISKATALPWRFFIKDNPHLSA
ncbi:MAG: DNA-3-methyladenine glycosylase [Verrucomicrobiota bacterium]